MKRFFVPLIIIFLSFSCKQKQQADEIMVVKADSLKLEGLPFLKSSKDQLYDKVLGMLVGSAIGDAMGAPTEMWSRYQIALEYGFVDSLDNMVRTPSPEGTWDYNLKAGGTTDDTRWKVLFGEYYLQNPKVFYKERSQTKDNAQEFASFLKSQYQKEIDQLKKTDSFEPAPFEQRMMRVTWLQEWAVVAKAYSNGDINEYADALSKFYAGEMVCAGLLYSPLIGSLYPGAPQQAYETGYELSIFDIGYARDITAITSAMVSEAFNEGATKKSILNIVREVDPKGYFKSRLIGRVAYNLYRDALVIVDQAKKSEVKVSSSEIVSDSILNIQREKAFALLAHKQKDYPFHAGEIYLINLTALIFTDFNFRDALAFVVNYGRDNDTVAAVTGAILGAFYGYSKIPDDLKEKILSTNKDKLGIDLELLASKISQQLLEKGVVKVIETQ